MSFATVFEDEAASDVELTTTQVANLVGVDRATVYHWVLAGRVPFRLGENNRRWIKAEHLPQLRQMRRDAKLCQDGRPIEQLKRHPEYRILARIIAERGPISASAASVGTQLNEDQALRRARRLERARMILRPSPRLWAITPQGRAWLDKHDGIDADAPAVATAMST